jgi:RimJ/RimL family protein N-acetyltransferase
MPSQASSGGAGEIRTARLRLRPARPDDLEAVHAILSDPVAMRYWSTPPHSSLAETRAWLDEMIDAPRTSRDFIVETEGRVIGKAGCWRLPEIGFILRPDCWGRGFAREALTAIIPDLFDRFPIPAVTADVDPRNAASLGLLRRLGFVETGRAERTWLVGDEYCDSVYLALARPA